MSEEKTKHQLLLEDLQADKATPSCILGIVEYGYRIQVNKPGQWSPITQKGFPDPDYSFTLGTRSGQQFWRVEGWTRKAFNKNK